MDRRTLLARAGAAFVGAAIPAGAGAAAPDGLSARARRKGRSFGCAVRAPLIRSRPDLRRAIARDADMIVPETELKWKTNEPRRGGSNYDDAEMLLRNPDLQGLAMRGHTALWHRSIPDWARPDLEAGKGAELMLRRVRDVVGRFRGRIGEWDVVNEAVEPKDGLAHAMRNSPIETSGGRDLVADCFLAAHEADPKARLYYNDYGVEYASDDEARKRDAILELLAFLKTRGAPLHGLGIQGHLTVGNRFRASVFRSFLTDVAAMGLDIRITELDVSDRRLPPDIAGRDEAVAASAGEFVETALDETAVAGIMTWGLADPSSWLDAERPRPDDAVQRALPLDEALDRKPFWQRLAKCFDDAPTRAQP